MSLTFAVEHGDRRHKALCHMLKQDGHSAVLVSSGGQGMPEVLPPGADAFIAPKLSPEMKQALENRGIYCIEYLSCEECVLANAVITAENAIQLAMQSSGKILAQTPALVLGFGRIGRELCRMLRGLGANPAAAARGAQAAVAIRAHGFTHIDIATLEQNICEFEMIFNTVPAPVLDEGRLELVSADAKIFDLASRPGGTDFGAAARLGIYAVHALALPGRMAPTSAAAAIKDAVYNILTEEGII